MFDVKDVYHTWFLPTVNHIINTQALIRLIFHIADKHSSKLQNEDGNRLRLNP